MSESRSSTALLSIDVINDMDFPGSTPLVEHCIRDDVPGREVARILPPHREDYFDNTYALQQMRTVLKAHVTPSDQIDLESLARKAELP